MAGLLAPPEPLDRGLHEAAVFLRTRPGATGALVADCLERIGHLDHQYRCMTWLDPVGAQVRAAELDARAANPAAQPLPLHGIPIVVKEIMAVDGMPDSTGSVSERWNKAMAEGPFVQSLRAAGCIILGKSLSTEFAFGQYNLGRPMPVNPAFSGGPYTTGGSSSGSAAAVAAGYCGFATGTDTGGSVRAPAAFTGTVGFKPAVGNWPMDGVLPLMQALDSPGVFTRTMADLIAVWRALGEANVPTAPASQRLGIAPEWFLRDLDSGVTAAWQSALERLAAAGHELVQLPDQDFSFVGEFFSSQIPAELVQQHGAAELAANERELDPLTWQRLRPALETVPDRAVLATARAAADAFLARCQDAGIDVWLSPVTPVCPARHEQLTDLDYLAAWQALASRNTRALNMLDVPAVSLPLQSDWPVGIQIAARRDHAAQLLGRASALEACLSGSL